MDTIRTDTSIITLQINDGPEVIAFDPSETLFAEKFYRLMRDLTTKEVEFRARAEAIDAKTELEEDGLPASLPETLAFMREACQFFRDEIDKLFGEGSSQKLFGDRYSLPAIGSFFTGITPYIKTARDERIAKYLPPKNSRKRRERA